MSSHRIVSLIASSTEIVCALGFESSLVGRSHECDYPSSILSLPICTSPKFNVDGTSYEIDQRVKSIVQEALSVYRVDAAILEDLQPTHIITQSQCEVCAVSMKDVEAAVCEMTSSRPAIVCLEPNALADIWTDMRRVADALGAPDRAEALITDLKRRMEDIRLAAAKAASRPRIACVEWIEPLMSGGNWMPELVELGSGENLYGEAGRHSPWMTWDELVAKDPDVIFVMPCGFNIPRTLEEMNLLSDRSEWASLKAVVNDQVFVADGNQYFNRPGPRVVESLEILAEVLHPDIFNFGHEGVGWVPYRK